MIHSKHGTAAVAVLLAVIMCATLVLSGCTGFFGARVDMEGTDPYQTPNVRGVWNAGNINDIIAPYFDEVIASLKQANSNESNELVGKMRYSVETIDGQNVLCSWIEGTSGQRIMLPKIILDAELCQVANHVPDCISDYEILKHVMNVASYGVNVDIYNMDSTMTASQMAYVLVSWFENKTGTSVDGSSVTVVSDDASKKLLSLIPDYPYADKLITDSDVTTSIFVDTLALLMSELNYEIYGVGSGNVKLMDFVRYAELFLNMYTPSGINYNYVDSADETESDAAGGEDASAEVKLESDWTKLVSEIVLFNTIDSVMVQSEEAVSRLDLAKNMHLVLKAGYAPDVKGQTQLSDCSDESAKIMIDGSVMSYFPKNSTLFTPDYKLRSNELPMLVANFTKYCFNSWNALGDYHYYDNLTMTVVCNAFASLESFYVSQSYYPPDSTAEIINNSAASDWFISSLNTGDYSENNVSVAAAAMALNWRGITGASVASLRDAFLSEAEGEWDDELIISALSGYGVTAAAYEDITTDVVLDELRAGNIVLARYSDTGSNEVQYMVIYGFEKIGNSVKFYINNPNAKHSLSIYANGSIPGKYDITESELALWLINEAGGDYVVVYAEGNAPAAEADESQQ